MDQLDSKPFDGRSVQNVFDEANTVAKDANERLHRAEALFALCAQQDLPPHTKGAVLQQLWQVQFALGKHKLFFSQAGQDKYIYENCFPHLKGGVFVEIGGFDGWQGSNTYFFEKSLGWTGLVVEACSTSIDKIRKVRHCEVVHAAVSDYDGAGDFLDIVSGYTQMGGLLSSYPEDILARIRQHPEHREQIFAGPVMRLDTLLSKYGMDHVDYCSIDVEGAERAIVQAADLASTDIAVISIENSSKGEQRSPQTYLEPQGFEMLAVVGYDEIYRKTD